MMTETQPEAVLGKINFPENSKIPSASEQLQPAILGLSGGHGTDYMGLCYVGPHEY